MPKGTMNSLRSVPCKACGKIFQTLLPGQFFCRPSCPEKKIQGRKKYKECKDRYKSNPQTQARNRNNYLEKKYGISSAEFDMMLSQQNGSCAICGRKDTGLTNQKYFHVDHVHGKKVVRGLLCHMCNTGLGAFKEDIDLLKAAVKYLISADEIESEC